MTQVSRKPIKQTLTRRRWGYYMLPLLIISVLVAGYATWQTGQLRFAASPVGVLALWMLLRFKTPPDGMKVTTIRSTPGAVAMLICCAASILLFAGLLVIDIFWLGHPFHAPLEPYHALLFAPPFILLLGSGFIIDRWQKHNQQNEDA